MQYIGGVAVMQCASGVAYDTFPNWTSVYGDTFIGVISAIVSDTGVCRKLNVCEVVATEEY